MDCIRSRTNIFSVSESASERIFIHELSIDRPVRPAKGKSQGLRLLLRSRDGGRSAAPHWHGCASRGLSRPASPPCHYRNCSPARVEGEPNHLSWAIRHTREVWIRDKKISKKLRDCQLEQMSFSEEGIPQDALGLVRELKERAARINGRRTVFLVPDYAYEARIEPRFLAEIIDQIIGELRSYLNMSPKDHKIGLMKLRGVYR